MEPIAFTSTAVGKITTHHWNFGNGNVSSEMSPQNIYLQPDRETSFLVNYSVVDEWGCEQTATKPIKIYSSCTVFIPNAFTPGNDGRNDAFRVLNAVKAENFELRIFNRWGQMLFQSKDWKKGWDGRLNGQLQPTGTYVWFVRYKDSRNNQLVERKGSVVLIR
jgi:gliding motility-associated-like protein